MPSSCPHCNGTRSVQPHSLREVKAKECPNPRRLRDENGERFIMRRCGCHPLPCEACKRQQPKKRERRYSAVQAALLAAALGGAGNVHVIEKRREV